jgi:hypothetical protein
VIVLISTSQVAKITGVSHQYPARWAVLPHHAFPPWSAATGPKQQSQVIVDWNFWNCEPK